MIESGTLSSMTDKFNMMAAQDGIFVQLSRPDETYYLLVACISDSPLNHDNAKLPPRLKPRLFDQGHVLQVLDDTASSIERMPHHSPLKAMPPSHTLDTSDK